MTVGIPMVRADLRQGQAPRDRGTGRGTQRGSESGQRDKDGDQEWQFTLKGAESQAERRGQPGVCRNPRGQ